MKNRVLITSVSRKVSLVQAFQSAGWVVIGQDLDPNAVALKFCDEIGDKSTPHDLWIPTRDAELPDTETNNICRDKLKFYHWCKEHGFKTPEVYFVKPRVSQSGKETECVWQELIGGEEYSVDTFSDFKSNVISVVPRIRLKTVGGESVQTITVKNGAIVEEALRLAQELKLVGHSVLQCKLQDSSIIWLDANLRFGGASIVAIRAGCHSPSWLLSLINGHEVKPCIGQYRIGLVGKSYTEWSFDENSSNP